jgi:hypothetical protein
VVDTDSRGKVSTVLLLAVSHLLTSCCSAR